MTEKELLRMNVPKLREEALKIPNIVGVTGMKKETLIQVLAEHNGIVLKKRSAGAEKTHIKHHIAAMKLKRDDAISRKAHEELHQIRRAIRTLKRKLRALAKEAKVAPAPAAEEAAPAESQAPEAPKAAAEATPEEAPAQES